MTEIAATLLLTAAALLAGTLSLRGVAELKRIRDAPTLTEWLALPIERRRDLRRKLHRGEAIGDPSEASAAAQAAARSEQVRRAMRPLELGGLIVVVSGIAFGFALHSRFLVVAMAGGALFFGATKLLAARQRRQIARSLEATRRLTG